MKKLFTLFLLAFLPLMASADPVEIDGICYSLSTVVNSQTSVVTHEATVTSNGYTGEIVIPESVVYEDVTYTVTSIGSSAFFRCSGLTSITIPNSVTSIGSSAFSGCTGLTSVTIPNSVTYIGNWAFSGCSGLTSITIPNSVTSIDYGAFENCSGLTSITIPRSVTSIGESAFSGCSNLKDVKIPVEDLSSFCNNSNVFFIYQKINKPFTLIDNEGMEIVNLIIPDDVTSIKDYAFYNCSGLSSVTIPNSVTSIGSCAFYDCGLVSAVIGSGVTQISQDAFGKPSSLKKTIWLTNTPPFGAEYAQGSINYVANDEYSFSNKVVYPFLSSYFDVDGIRYVPVSLSDKTCDAIDCVYNESAKDTKIASTVTYKGVTMSVKSIQPYIGNGNKYIESLTIDNDGELGKYAFTNCSNMKSLTIGSKVSSIGSYAFQGCSSLESVTIPNLDEVIN